jgi:HEAT repeat protein
VTPEATPHPRKVKFQIGGEPAPGAWYRRGEAIDDDRVIALFADDAITDVMVAGDFVTIGITSRSSWEERLDPLLDRVTELFWDGQDTKQPERTRDELLEEAGRLSISEVRPEDLHLMDPDRPEHRALLIAALDAEDPRHRRAAVATLALSSESEVAQAAVVTGYREESRVVRRTALDAAADLENDVFRPLFEEAIFDRDAWIRWRAVRALADIGAKPSEEQIILATADEDFQVRLEANAVWRSIESD